MKILNALLAKDMTMENGAHTLHGIFNTWDEPQLPFMLQKAVVFCHVTFDPDDSGKIFQIDLRMVNPDGRTISELHLPIMCPPYANEMHEIFGPFTFLMVPIDARGEYAVDIRINGTLERRVSFWVNTPRIRMDTTLTRRA